MVMVLVISLDIMVRNVLGRKGVLHGSSEPDREKKIQEQDIQQVCIAVVTHLILVDPTSPRPF